MCYGVELMRDTDFGIIEHRPGLLQNIVCVCSSCLI